MPCVIRHSSLALFLALTGVLAGCSSPKPEFEKEDFTQNDTYSRTIPASSAAACDAGRRALLSQGYNIDKFEGSRVTGHKNFQDESGQHTQIAFNIECASDGGSNERATVFANAVQDRYSIKRTASSASVGVSVLGQVSMPFGSSDDSLVKTGSQTVARPKFYEGFFQLLQRFLPDAQAAAAPHAPAGSRAKPQPKAAAAEPAETPDKPADTLNPATATGAAGESAKTPAATSASPAAAQPASAGAAAPTAPASSAPASTSPASVSPTSTSPASTSATPASSAPSTAAPTAPAQSPAAGTPASTAPAQATPAAAASPEAAK
ncbi:DUF2242 domain-containing protein [Achromobacter anxifer]|uniref:DUF2242 domain-containing protein n=1 Tax=Achromobacter anxifer TaxID=1287737 RepID=UPI0023F8AFE7|nr:DUF2242 domain-containing protein [Achromobacter anxifer]MDF8359706.1 DUF2242 domain-containing protein [Achromobacter anxifer]